MLNLKKTAVAVLAFGSSAVFAGTMGPVCTPGSVTVPCPRTAWDFGAQALYLQTSASGLDYIGSVVNAAGAETFPQINNRWGWGFQIEGSYHFNTGNDLDLNWYHLDVSKNRTDLLGVGQLFTDTYGNIWAPNSGVSMNGSNKWDAVNLEFGQHVDMGEFVNMRFHGGVEYARVSNSATLRGSLSASTGIPVGSSQVIQSTITYNGFGPRVGADLGYGWNNGLSAYAKGAMSMLVGQSKFNRTNTMPVAVGTGPAGALSAASGVFSASGSRTTVNPELEAKLGATYTYAMAQGDLSLDIGWMWVNYFNVLHHVPTGRGFVTASDFGVQGPFVGLKWVGNVA